MLLSAGVYVITVFLSVFTYLIFEAPFLDLMILAGSRFNGKFNLNDGQIQSSKPNVQHYELPNLNSNDKVTFNEAVVNNNHVFIQNGGITNEAFDNNENDSKLNNGDSYVVRL